MAVLLFVLFWSLVAIGLVVMGIRGGKRGQPTDVDVARGGRAHWYIGFAVVALVFGVGVPVAASIGRANDSDTVPAANISDLTEEEEDGRELFARYCSQCHALDAANAVAQVGPDLDMLRPPQSLVLDAIENGRARGNGAMAANLVVGEDAEHVAAFVAKAVGQEAAGGEEGDASEGSGSEGSDSQ